MHDHITIRFINKEIIFALPLTEINISLWLRSCKINTYKSEINFYFNVPKQNLSDRWAQQGLSNGSTVRPPEEDFLGGHNSKKVLLVGSIPGVEGVEEGRDPQLGLKPATCTLNIK